MVLPLGDMEKTRIVPVVTYALIALNVAVFLYQLDRGEEFTDTFAATPYEITHNVDLAGPIEVESPGDENPLDRPGRVEIVRRAIPHEPLPRWFPVWLTIFTSMF